jgi:glucokinase
MYILFDIGGSKMRFAATRDCKELVGEPVVVESPDDFNEGIEKISEVVSNLCDGESVDAAGGGIAGPLDKEKTKLINAPNKPSWVNKPIKRELERVLDAPVHIENDSAIAGLGEACHGAGKGHDIVVYITVSTGVGGARIVGGRIGQSAMGFEPGHQIIDMDHSACPDCKSRTLEDHISGTATERRYGVPPYEVTSDNAWEEIARWLACGITNTILHWSPEIVVIGGSMVVKKPGIYVSDVQRHLESTLTIFPKEHHPEIVEATCGDFGGIWGAMAFVDQHR